MEVFGVNAALIAVFSGIVVGMIEWFKTPTMPTWAVRLISLAVSYVIVGLALLVNPMTWQLFIVTGAVVFLFANGIWHIADSVGISISKNEVK